MEFLKKLRIKFRTKIKVEGREIDFIIKKFAIDIDCHEQDTLKNEMLIRNGYTPIHFSNNEVKKLNDNKNKYTEWFNQ